MSQFANFFSNQSKTQFTLWAGYQETCRVPSALFYTVCIQPLLSTLKQQKEEQNTAYQTVDATSWSSQGLLEHPPFTHLCLTSILGQQAQRRRWKQYLTKLNLIFLSPLLPPFCFQFFFQDWLLKFIQTTSLVLKPRLKERKQQSTIWKCFLEMRNPQRSQHI